MSVVNFIAIHPTAVEPFHSKNTNFNLMVALEEESKSCQDIADWTKVVDQLTDQQTSIAKNG